MISFPLESYEISLIEDMRCLGYGTIKDVFSLPPKSKTMTQISEAEARVIETLRITKKIDTIKVFDGKPVLVEWVGKTRNGGWTAIKQLKF